MQFEKNTSFRGKKKFCLEKTSPKCYRLLCIEPNFCLTFTNNIRNSSSTKFDYVNSQGVHFREVGTVLLQELVEAFHYDFAPASTSGNHSKSIVEKAEEPRP